MADASLADPRSVVAPWGLLDALGAYLVGTVGSGIVAAAVGADADSGIGARFLATVPLWLAFVVGPIVATSSRGRGPRVDLRLSFRPIDASAVLVGVVAQLGITAAYLPFVSREELEAPSRVLLEASPGGGRLILLAMTCLIAPLTEELFYRGLVMGSLDRRFAPAAAAGITAVLFGASHFQLLQLPGLIAFGFLAGMSVQRTGRLGTAIALHAGFNATAIWFLLR